MGGQVRFLQVSFAAAITNKGLATQVARLVILEIVIRHETLAALLAMVSKVALVHPSNVGLQRDFVYRNETTYLASICDIAVDLHVVIQFRQTFEGSLANCAFERTLVAVLYHMLFVLPMQSKIHMAYGTFVRRTLSFLFSSFFGINRSIFVLGTRRIKRFF